jgi:hypothetical protein
MLVIFVFVEMQVCVGGEFREVSLTFFLDGL